MTTLEQAVLQRAASQPHRLLSAVYRARHGSAASPRVLEHERRSFLLCGAAVAVGSSACKPQGNERRLAAESASAFTAPLRFDATNPC
jgi:hypothetical protein